MELRQARLRDFEQRAAFSPQSVYLHREKGWRYIPIHPFSSEPEHLVRLGMKSEDCLLVDAWCEIEGDVTLLQTYVVDFIEHLGAGYLFNDSGSDLAFDRGFGYFMHRPQ